MPFLLIKLFFFIVFINAIQTIINALEYALHFVGQIAILKAHGKIDLKVVKCDFNGTK